MTRDELIKALQEIPENLPVYIAYSALVEVENVRECPAVKSNSYLWGKYPARIELD